MHTYRYLDQNQLDGTIPSELGYLTNLEGLYVYALTHSRVYILLHTTRGGFPVKY